MSQQKRLQIQPISLIRTQYNPIDVPPDTYYWDNDFPRHMSLRDNGRRLLRAAECGQVTTQLCAVLEALIKERYVLLWGTRVWNVTDTLNNVHKAYLASTKHFMHVTHKWADLKKWMNSTSFHQLSPPQRTELRKKMGQVNNLVVNSEGQGIAVEMILSAWDHTLPAQKQHKTLNLELSYISDCFTQAAITAHSAIGGAQGSEAQGIQQLVRTLPDIPTDAYSRSRKRKATRAFEDEMADWTETQRATYLSEAIIVDSPHCKDPHKPESHHDHTISALSLKLYEKHYHILHSSAIAARQLLLQSMAVLKHTPNLSFQDVSEEFAIPTYLTVQLLVEHRVYHGLIVYPSHFAQWLQPCPLETLKRTLDDVAIRAHIALTHGGVISDGTRGHERGARIKPWSRCEQKLKEIWQAGNGIVSLPRIAAAFDDYTCVSTFAPTSNLTTTQCEQKSGEGLNAPNPEAAIDTAWQLDAGLRGVAAFSQECRTSRTIAGFILIQKKIVGNTNMAHLHTVHESIMNADASQNGPGTEQGL